MIKPYLALVARAAAALALCTGSLLAQDTTGAGTLPTVVTVIRDEPHPALSVPAAVTVVHPDSARPGDAHTAIDETLFGIPGLTVANRSNPSQDDRIAIRGFGARSQFGVRSIRVIRDGMPLTMADGQTAIDYLDLEDVGSVEVLRGTASALYGNASGGVIDIESKPAPARPVDGEVRLWTGSDHLHHTVGLIGGTDGPLSYELNVGHTDADGVRQFSLQRTTDAYGHATLRAANTDWTLSVLALNAPTEQNPGALTRAQFNADPTQADALSVSKDARKSVKQFQTGIGAHHVFSDGSEWLASTYIGTRELFNPQTFAVVGVAWTVGGASLRFTKSIVEGLSVFRLTAGADAQYENDWRNNWTACDGVAKPTATCPSLPEEEGALTLQQRELVSSIGPYVRGEMTRGKLDATVGFRDDDIDFKVDDHYLADGDDSGDRRLGAVSPMGGISYRFASTAAAYATVSTGFETPTVTELGNKPDGSGGLNPDLDPQFSTTYEVGLKGSGLGALTYDLALFHTPVRNELIPYEVPGGSGRTYYRNAGATRRDGAELALSDQWGHLAANVSYALSRFRFHSFVVDSASYAGNAIPGIPMHELQGSLTWQMPTFFAMAEAVGKSTIWVNDANQAQAPGFAILNLRAGLTHLRRAAGDQPGIELIGGIQNLFNTQYVGSVAINASGASLAATKFYEPGAGRTFLLGLQLGQLRDWR